MSLNISPSVVASLKTRGVQMSQEKALVSSLAGTGKARDFSGTWVNELTSEMTIVQSGDGLVGEYKSAKSSDGHETKGKLVGYVDGTLISFVVHWDDFQAITAWVGEIDQKAATETINTLW